MKIYISGKITGDRRYKAKFREVEKKLAAADPMSLVQETCVAEFTHFVLILLGFYALRLWPGTGGAIVTAIYILFGNLPFLIIQRYNRPRLQRLLAAQQRRSAKENK